MTDKKTKPEYQITWPEGAELKMDPKHLMEIRNSLETQFKMMIYKQPGFKYFPSMGNTNFFQHFRTNDGIDFGVCHLYWDKDADDKIDYADKDGNIISKQVGGWCVRWLTKQEFDNMPEEDSVISPEGKRKIEDAFEEKLKQAALANLERFQKEQKEKQELMELGEEPPKFLN